MTKKLTNSERLIASSTIIWGVIHSVLYILGFVAAIYLYSVGVEERNYFTNFSPISIIYRLVDLSIYVISAYWAIRFTNPTKFVKNNSYFLILIGIFTFTDFLFNNYITKTFKFAKLIIYFIVMVGAFSLTYNGFYLKKKDWGYHYKNTKLR